MKNDKTIVILGGGPAGLSCAWHLIEKGYKIVLIEKENRCGGLCRTFDYQGFKFDLGGHRFISSNNDLINKVKYLLKENILIRERKSIVKIDGQEFTYPINIRDLLTKLDFWTIIKINGDLLYKSLGIKKTEVNSLEDWCISKFGKTIYNKFFKAYNEKLWGISAKYISSDWAAQRIPSLNIRNFLISLIDPRPEKIRTFAKHYLYPKTGMGTIFDHITKVIDKKGVKIFTNCELTEIVYENTTIKKINLLQNKNPISINCDYLISTIPLSSLISLFSGYPMFSRLNTLANDLKDRSLRFMNILIDRPKISDNTWQYIPQKEVIFTRIQEPRLRSPFMVPADKTSLMLEIPCNKGDSIWDMEETKLLSKVLNDLKILNINISKNEILGYFSTYAEYAYPIYTHNYYQNRKQIIDFFIDHYENIILCGRQGTFNYLFMDFAMLAGIHAAEYILNKNTALDRKKIANIMNFSELVETKSLI